MERVTGAGRGSLALIVAGLGTAVVFEGFTVLATQDASVRAGSPWQDDPYDVVVSLTQFAVPMLALATGLRLLAWRGPEVPDRAHQMLRAVGAMLALIAATVVVEWAALVLGIHADAWMRSTRLLVGGLVLVSTLTAVLAAMLWRSRRPRGSSRQWRHDWLGDMILLGQRVPLLRHWATPRAADRVRRHAMTLFVTLSAVAALAIGGALAVGEAWTNPLLIAWALIVLTTSNLAFCVLSNIVAGFIARPPRSRTRRVVEVSVLAGCVAVQVTTAFRDPLWELVASGPVTGVPTLAALTLGAGVLVTGLTAALHVTERR